MGIDEELLPDDYQDGLKLMDIILKRQAAPSEAGKKLTRALVIFAETLLPKRLKNIPQMIITYFADTRIEEAIGLKECFPWYIRFLPHFLTKIFRITSRLRDFNTDIEEVIEQVAYKLTLAMVNYFNNYKGTSFYVSESLKKDWTKNEAKNLLKLD